MKRYDRSRFNHGSRIVGGACDVSHYNEDYDYVVHEVAHATLLFGRVFHGMQELVSFTVGRMTKPEQNAHEIETCALQLAVATKLGFVMADEASWFGCASLSWLFPPRTK